MLPSSLTEPDVADESTWPTSNPNRRNDHGQEKATQEDVSPRQTPRPSKHRVNSCGVNTRTGTGRRKKRS
jgi:hypothetical protein